MIFITILQFTLVIIYMLSPIEGYNQDPSDSDGEFSKRGFSGGEISEDKRSIKEEFPINDNNECMC
jgi:hypothetical protein